jgi:hypothetical protein
VRKVVTGIVVGALGFLAYDRFLARPRSPPLAAPAIATDLVEAPDSTRSSDSFRCDGRTYCSQMTSCEEATWFLQNCPGVKMDREGDGVPCERQWCGSH